MKLRALPLLLLAWTLAGAAPVAAQTYLTEYDPALGTLPSAQGWAHVLADPAPDDGLDETQYSVAAGELTQAWTGGVNNDVGNVQAYQLPGVGFDFDVDVVELRVDLQIVGSSRTLPGGATPGAGFALELVDREGEQVFLFIADEDSFLHGSASSAVSQGFYNLGFHEFRLRAGPDGARLYVDGVPFQSLDRGDFATGATPNTVRFGDVLATEMSGSRLQSLRFARFEPTVPEVRGYEWLTEEGAPGLHTFTSETVSCTSGNTAISGGAKIFDGDGSVQLRTSRYGLGSFGWSTTAADDTPLASWHLRADALCGELPNLERVNNTNPGGPDQTAVVWCEDDQVAVGGGFSALNESVPITVGNPGSLDKVWEVRAFETTGDVSDPRAYAGCASSTNWFWRTNTTAHDSTSPKSIGAVCPTGSVVLGGSAQVFSLGATDLTKLAITASFPEGFAGQDPILWSAVAEERLQTPNDWGLTAKVVCGLRAEPSTTRVGLVGRWGQTFEAADEWDEHDGVLHGATWDPGIRGSAFTLDAASQDWVEIPQADGAFYPGDGSFSVDVFFRDDETSPHDFTTLVALHDAGGSDTPTNASRWSIHLLAEGYARGVLHPMIPPFTQILEGTTDLRDGKVHHVALVRDMEALPDVSHLYVDGQLVDSEFVQGVNRNISPAGTPDPISIGIWRDSLASTLSQEFDGQIDDVKYYDRALDPEEIRNIAGCEVPIVPRVLNVDARRFGFRTESRVEETLCVFLEAGLYDLELVNPSLDPEARFLAWSGDVEQPNGWNSEFFVVDENLLVLAGNGVIGQATAQDAFDLSPKHALLSVSSDQKVYFLTADGNDILDNAGGVSLRITPMPEPGVTTMLVAGLLLLTRLRRARRIPR